VFERSRYGVPRHRPRAPRAWEPFRRDEAVDTYSLNPRTWRVLFLFNRSPLIRRSDRIEVLVMALAVVASLLAVPFIGAIATNVYRAHRSVYVEQSRTPHRVFSPTPPSKSPAPAWLHQFEVNSPDPAIDTAVPSSQAAYDAVGMAIVSEGAVVLIAAAVGIGTHHRLGRTRYSQWDRELASVLGSEGGRSPRDGS
jgi:hypothetical protein